MGTKGALFSKYHHGYFPAMHGPEILVCHHHYGSMIQNFDGVVHASLTRLAVVCSEQILERKKQALQAKEALEQEQLRNVEADKQAREAERSQAKARRNVEAQRAQQRAALDLQQKTAYFQVSYRPTTFCLQKFFGIVMW